MKNVELTEKEFDQFLLRYDYYRVSHDVGHSPNFANADYINKERRIVIELKTLNKDFFINGGMIPSLNAFIIIPKNVDERGMGQYIFSVPKQNREGKHDSFEEPLRRIIKKANKQIKETKCHYFERESALGFLILAQTGFESLGADITAQVVKKIVDQEFGSIDGIIICTPYHRSKNPTTMEVNPICVSVTNERDQIKKTVCMEIADNWCEFWGSGGHR